jgi:hypothetical protein
MDLPLSKVGDKVFNSILVIVDRYMKMNIYVPINKICNSVELASLLIDAVVYRYRVLKGIISNRGSVFTS